MAYSDRLKLYRKIENLRGRPLIVYSTRLSDLNGGAMSLDSIPSFCEQIDSIPERYEDVDVLIISYGGDPISAWRIINLLRERFKTVDVLVPFVAQSAATIFSFGADHIVMHRNACLGPTDAQVNLDSSPVQKKTISVQDVRYFLEFVRDDMKFDDRELLYNSLESLSSELTPTEIGYIKKTTRMSTDLSEKMLSLHMSDKKQISKISDVFNTFSHHGYTIGRKEALDLGLPVESPSKELSDLMWKVWNDLANEMKCNRPFDPMGVMMSDPARMSNFNKNVSSGMPYTMMVQENLTVAVIESIRKREHFDSTLNILASGNSINISFNVMNSPKGWTEGD